MTNNIQRPESPSIKLPFRIALYAAAAVALLIAFAQPAHAQFMPGFDPAGQVESFAQNNNWLSKAQGWARTIYLSLLIFEIFALGVTTLLFRENLGEFFGSLTLKIVLGSLFFYFISVAGPAAGQLPGAVMRTFGTTFGQGMGGSDSVTDVAVEGLAASGLYFGASYLMRQEDGQAATTAEIAAGNCVQLVVEGSGGGVCYHQPSETVEFSRQVSELLTSAMGVMVGMAVAAVYLQFTLITIESYFVMTAGTLFIGFAGSRFTMPFSQGYFSYMVSVGVKLMALYLAIGIVGPLMYDIMYSAAGSFIQGSYDVTGVSVLVAAAYGALSVVVGAGIIAMVPGFAASFISGQSFASGAAALSQAANSFAGSAQMLAQLGSSSMSRQQAMHDRENVRSVEQSMAKYGQSGAMAPAIAQGAQTFAPAASGASLGSGVGGQSVVGDTLGFNRAPSMNAPDAARPVEVTGSARAEVREQATPLAQNGSPSELPVSGREDVSRTAIDDATADRMVAGPFADGRPTGVFADREKAVPLGRNGITQSGDPQLISGADRFAPGNSPIAGGSASDRALAPPAQSAGSEKVFADREQAVPLPPNGVTQNGAAGSPSQADQSAESPPADYQDATYTPVQPTTVLSANGQPMGVQMGSSGDGSRLDGLKVADLEKMSRKDVESALPNTDWSKLDDQSRKWLIQNDFGNDALEKDTDKANADSVQAELAEGYALSGLSQAVIRDVGPPTAVQVRISAPDKL